MILKDSEITNLIKLCELVRKDSLSSDGPIAIGNEYKLPIKDNNTTKNITVTVRVEFTNGKISDLNVGVFDIEDPEEKQLMDTLSPGAFLFIDEKVRKISDGILTEEEKESFTFSPDPIDEDEVLH